MPLINIVRYIWRDGFFIPLQGIKIPIPHSSCNFIADMKELSKIRMLAAASQIVSQGSSKGLAIPFFNVV